MKSYIKQPLTFLGLFAVSGTIAFFSCSFNKKDHPNYGNNNDSEYVSEIVEQTPQEKLLNSVLSLNTFKVDLSLNVTLEDYSEISFTMDNGEASLGNLGSTLMLEGDLAFNLAGLKTQMHLGYYSETLYFDLSDNHFRIDNADLFDFIYALPDYNINIELPEAFQSFDLAKILDDIKNMEYVSTPDNGQYFLYTLGQDEDGNDILLHIKTDSEYNFKGIRSDNIHYKGSTFLLDCSLTACDPNELNLMDPKEDLETYNKYQNFAPALDVFHALISTFENDTNTINVKINVDDDTSGVKEDYITADLDFTYDKPLGLFAINGFVNEETKFDKDPITKEESLLSRKHEFDIIFSNETSYVDYNSLKVALNHTSITDIVDYVVSKVSDETFEMIIEKVVELLQDPELQESMNSIPSVNDIIKTITVSEGKIEVALSAEAFNLTTGDIIIVINSSDDSLESITLDNVVIGCSYVDVTISLKTFNPITLVTENYVQVDHALTLIDAVYKLANRKTFRLEFDGLIDDQDELTNNISIDGGLQFDIENNFGYGELNLVDQDLYNHNIFADMKTVDEILFSYNSELRGKFAIRSLKEIMTLMSDVAQNPDDHFLELFGDLLNMFADTPLTSAINGDYGILLSTGLFSNLVVDDEKISIDVSLRLIGLDGSFNIVINYDPYGILEDDNPILKSFEINDLEISGSVMNFKLELKDFNPELESTRLDPSLSYYNFSDIKILLELGINTQKYNYYELSGKVNLNMSFIGIDAYNKDIPIVIKIRNDHGNVDLEINMPNIPIISIINGNPDYTSTDSREASVYYRDGMIYMYRHDVCKNGLFGIYRYYDYYLTSNCDSSYFFDNIIEYLCKHLLGLKDLVYSQIVSSSVSGSDEQIHYEKLLTNFEYVNTTDGSGNQLVYFDFGINISELAHNEDLKSLTLRVYEDTSKNEMSRLIANLSIQVGITININLDVSLTDNSSVELTEENKLVNIDNYLSTYGGNATNTIVSESVKR
ncbi:MAG: hypothetical protein ACI31G_03275 [Bacilli bacterium]